MARMYQCTKPTQILARFAAGGRCAPQPFGPVGEKKKLNRNAVTCIASAELGCVAYRDDMLSYGRQVSLEPALDGCAGMLCASQFRDRIF